MPHTLLMLYYLVSKHTHSARRNAVVVFKLIIFTVDSQYYSFLTNNKLLLALPNV